jgi:hypothetical protein
VKSSDLRFNSERAEALVRRLRRAPRSPLAGVLMNDLLSEFHRGYPVQHLRPLLLSEDAELVQIGAWIASELGLKGKPLFGDIFSLLRYPESKVRFSVIDCLLLWADPSKKLELASLIELIEDPEPRVRWKVMDFLSRATTAQLSAAASYLEAANPESKNLLGLRLLLNKNANNAEEVNLLIRGQDGILRKYGVVLAGRIAAMDKAPLVLAALSVDPDVKDFAESSIALL